MKYFILIVLLILPLAVYAKAHHNTATASVQYKYTVHTGSYSLDRNSLTQREINKMVSAIVKAIPNANYIAIAPYMDYPQQTIMWAQAIHNNGRHVSFRTAGWNSWQGQNGSQATGTPAAHIASLPAYIASLNGAVWAGDIFEAVPDEPENSPYWNATYTSLGTQAGKDAFNTFIRDAIQTANANLPSGVLTGYVWTNPSASKDVIDATTTAMLSALSTDDYPELNADWTGVTDPQVAAGLMASEIVTWLTGTKPREITFGRSVYTQLTPQTQAAMYQAEFNAIRANVPTLSGITVWQGGANDNPKSRLFDYSNGNWIARPAASVVNNNFR